MPLIKRASKKALEHNIKAEMEAHPDKRKQDLAIAFSVQRKAKAKKMAEGGVIDAKHEKRPMPNDLHEDAQDAHQNSGKKVLKDDQWTDAPQDKQAQRGPKIEKVKHPKMVPQSTYSVKMRSFEDDLEEHAAPAQPNIQLPHDLDEEEAHKSGPPVQHMKMMAKGGVADQDGKEHHGQVDDEYGGKIEDDMLEEPSGLESDNDEMSPEMKEYMASRMPAYAAGGIAHEEEMQPEDEAMEEHHDSIAAAIMARKARAKGNLLADGGVVDLDENAEEQPNQEYGLEEAALKENYDEPLHSIHEPHDSNLHADEREEHAENEHDMISKIRGQMNKRRQFR